MAEPVGSEARTAVVWSVLHAELDRVGRPLRVVDVGGGTGGFAVPLARLGHAVTVIDPSPDALATLARRADTAGVSTRVTGIQGDTDTLAEHVAPDSVDLVLCHSLLEMVEDPGGTLDVLAARLTPGGAVSLLVANRAAAVLARAVGGHYAEALTVLGDPARFDPDLLVALVASAGLTVEALHGVRVVADLVPGALRDGDPGGLATLELALATRSPYRDLGTQLHVLARR